jgi:hypothetical protein
MEEPHFASTLTDTYNDLLFALSVPRLVLMPTLDSADVSFVHFDGASQFPLPNSRHRGSDAMAEIPRRLIATDSEHSLNLASGDPLLRLRQNESGDEPLRKGEMRVIENGASGDAKLRLAVDAAEYGFAPLDTRNLFSGALRADSAIGPTQTFEVLSALDFAVKTGHKIREVKRRTRRPNRSHSHAPMKKKRKKTDREVLKELFPKEIVEEVDAILNDVDAPSRLRRSNPSGKKLPKPWGRKWTEEKKRQAE